jgi:hypothetical protein
MLDNVILPNVTDFTGLGITIDSTIRFTKHYRFIINKAHHRASFILKTFCSRDPELLFRAFSVYVRPYLYHGSPVWAPVYKSDIVLIEHVQRRFTKRLSGLRNIPYLDT